MKDVISYKCYKDQDVTGSPRIWVNMNDLRICPGFLCMDSCV